MDSIELAFAGAAEQARMLAAGAVTAPALTDLYLERIARLDPELRAYRVVFTDAARKAAAAAQERLDAGERLPLLGVPIAIKDDVDVAGEVTTYGSTAHGPAPTKDAEVVRLLREAGAVILGKTAVPEMMIWPFTETVSYGATHNPWDISRTPGGSSGGSGAAVAAGLAPFALGSDGAGSIRIPSTWCGLFGIKPQRDRVPMAPHDDAWCGMSVNGPLTHTVEDAALFLDVTCDKSMPGPEGGFVRAASRPPNRLRIALSTKVPPPLTAHRDAEQRAAVHQAGAVLRELGHDVVVRDIDYGPTAVYGQVLPRYLPRRVRRCPDVAAPGAARLPHPRDGPHRPAVLRCPDRQNPCRRGESVGAGAVDLRRRRRGDHPGHRDRTVPDRRLPQARRGVDAGAGRRPGAVPGGVQRDGSAGRRRAVGAGPPWASVVDPVGGQAF